MAYSKSKMCFFPQCYLVHEDNCVYYEKSSIINAVSMHDAVFVTYPHEETLNLKSLLYAYINFGN